MSYCVNPTCPHPKNPANATNCQGCGSKLLLQDRYRVLGLLGKGGFGATFATIDLGLPGKPPCVVKQLRPATDDPHVFQMAKELFEREAQTLGRVGNHPQVPRLLNYFEEQQQFYLVQEYIKGHNLHQEVKKRGPFTEVGVKQFLSELLPVLKYIHSQKVIHRDIKPANLIRRETDRKLVLIDFGAVKNQVNTMVASNTSSQTALTNFAVGTQGFAPPEQMAMRPVYASDIYAVGVTCIYLLTAKSPKDLGIDPNTGEILWKPCVTVSKQFANVLETMLELAVKQRYKTAEEALQALELTDYSDSLQQGLITMPSTETLQNQQLSQSEPTTEVSTHFNTARVAPRRSRSATPSARSQTSSYSPPARNNAYETGGGGFQMADAGGVTRKKSRHKEPATPKKPRRLEAREVIAAYNKGNKDFAQQEFGVVNFTRVRLPGINFYESQFGRANFQGADLSNADFGKASLKQASLRNANLCGAYLGYADLEGADLRGADLSNSHLKYANLRGANLCGTNLLDAQVTPQQLKQAKTNWMTVMPSGKRGFW